VSTLFNIINVEKFPDIKDVNHCYLEILIVKH